MTAAPDMERPGSLTTNRADEISSGEREFVDQSTADTHEGRKRCARCGEVKPYSAFGRKCKASDGLDWWCKLCNAAYRADKRDNSPVARWLRGETNDAPESVELWLRANVVVADALSCWMWTGPINPDGYGYTSLDGVGVFAHRVALRYWRKLIVPGGMNYDHTCRNRLCVNPFHGEIVTPRENTLRGAGISAQNARKTHCDKGHELSGDNLYVYPDGRRECRACKRERKRAYRERARTGELTGLQKLKRGIFARTIVFNVEGES